MDQFVGELVKAFNSVENQRFLFDGDHLPSLEIEDENLTYGNKYQ